MKNSFSLRAAAFSGLVAAVATLVGCSSGSLEPVSGKVVYPDGTPVPAGTITFNNSEKQVSATGVIAQDGTFTLNFGESEGAPAGEYKVVISGGGDSYDAKPTVASIYGDPINTPLRQTIVDGKNELEIKVERPK
jgi:hypothetical protein